VFNVYVVVDETFTVCLGEYTRQLREHEQHRADGQGPPFRGRLLYHLGNGITARPVDHQVPKRSGTLSDAPLIEHGADVREPAQHREGLGLDVQ